MFALDELVVRPGKCKHLHDYVYTFANGYQDLELEYLQPISRGIGQLVTPQRIQPKGAPPVDHTTNSAGGTYYLFKNDNTFLPTIYKDVLAMIELPVDSSYSCIRFAYQSMGNATFKVYSVPKNAYTTYYQHAVPLWKTN